MASQLLCLVAARASRPLDSQHTNKTFGGELSMYSRAVAGVFRQLREKLRDPAVRRAAGSLMLAKLIGLGLALLLISKWYLPSAAYADTAPALPPPHINALTTVC